MTKVLNFSETSDVNERKIRRMKGKRSNEKFLTLRYTALHPRVRFVGKVLGELRTRVGDRPFRKRV